MQIWYRDLETCLWGVWEHEYFDRNTWLCEVDGKYVIVFTEDDIPERSVCIQLDSSKYQALRFRFVCQLRQEVEKHLEEQKVCNEKKSLKEV